MKALWPTVAMGIVAFILVYTLAAGQEDQHTFVESAASVVVRVLEL